MTVCVNCGSDVLGKKTGEPVNQVYDEQLAAKSGIIKLLECSCCGDYVDKYIEYEGCLVLLDLALQHRPAIRHTLINQDRRTLIVKMAFLTLIVDGYSCWASESTGEEFFEREFEFYWRVGQCLVGLFTYLSVILLNTWISQLIKERVWRPDYWRLFIGLLMAYGARFLKLGALLWGTESTQFLWFFVDFLFFLTSLNVIRTMSGLGSAQSTAITLVSHASLHLVELVRP